MNAVSGINIAIALCAVAGTMPAYHGVGGQCHLSQEYHVSGDRAAKQRLPGYDEMVLRAEVPRQPYGCDDRTNENVTN